MRQHTYILDLNIFKLRIDSFNRGNTHTFLTSTFSISNFKLQLQTSNRTSIMSTLGFSNAADVVPFPLIPRLQRSEYVPHDLKEPVNVGTAANPNMVKRCKVMFRLTTEDREMLAALVLEFFDACTAASLNLTTGPQRYAKFRELLDEPYRSEFDNARIGQANTVAGFDAALRLFLNRYFLPTDFADQQRYLQRAKKPFKLSVVSLASRLRQINLLMSVINNFNVPYDEPQLKELFFPMMLTEWQLQFSQGTLEITDPAVTFQRVIRFMTLQETATNARNNNKRGRNDDHDNNNNDSMGDPDSGHRSTRCGGCRGRVVDARMAPIVMILRPMMTTIPTMITIPLHETIGLGCVLSPAIFMLGTNAMAIPKVPIIALDGA